MIFKNRYHFEGKLSNLENFNHKTKSTSVINKFFIANNFKWL